MPDGNEVIVHEEEVEMNPISKLIWEVSQQPVLYDSQNPLYKDGSARQVAWQNVAREMKIPVTDCQIKWGTLRRCLANARKRQMKRQAGGSKFVKKWRYQDEMSFLLPFIDQREYEFVNVSPRRRKAGRWKRSRSVFAYQPMNGGGGGDPLANDQDLLISEEYVGSGEPTDDSAEDMKPRRETLRTFVVGKPVAASSPPGRQRHQGRRCQTSPSMLTAADADEMYIEEDEIENVPIDSDGGDSFTLPQRLGGQLLQQRLFGGGGGAAEYATKAAELGLDEMDSFFLSMSKALKKLPQVEQINVRSQVYELVTRAEISWLRKASPPRTPAAAADS